MIIVIIHVNDPCHIMLMALGPLHHLCMQFQTKVRRKDHQKMGSANQTLTKQIPIKAKGSLWIRKQKEIKRHQRILSWSVKCIWLCHHWPCIDLVICQHAYSLPTTNLKVQVVTRVDQLPRRQFQLRAMTFWMQRYVEYSTCVCVFYILLYRVSTPIHTLLLPELLCFVTLLHAYHTQKNLQPCPLWAKPHPFWIILERDSLPYL